VAFRRDRDTIARVDGFEFVHRDTVRFRDLDAWGHVNNAVYLTYCEDARMGFLAELGVLTGVADATMILAHAEIDFRSPARVGEELEIGVRTTRVGTKSFELEYEVRAGDRLVAESSSVLVAYDYDTRESVALPAHWRAALDRGAASTPPATRSAGERDDRQAYVIGGGTRGQRAFPRENKPAAQPS
jgi:acyl-CoA thioester hydrolase